MHLAKNAHEHTGSAEAVRPSLRNGFTAYFALSPARPGLFATVIPKKRELLKNLTPATGASGPHDFAVRISHARQSQLSRPPHPTARFVTCATPLVGWDGVRCECDLPLRSSLTAATHWDDGQFSECAVKFYLLNRSILFSLLPHAVPSMTYCNAPLPTLLAILNLSRLRLRNGKLCDGRICGSRGQVRGTA
jgi:hypothetical protein